MSAPNFTSGGLWAFVGPMYRQDICDTCPFLTKRSVGTGGWCSRSENRVPPMPGWPDGFTPSVAFDGGCDLHPARAGDASKAEGR